MSDATVEVAPELLPCPSGHRRLAAMMLNAAEGLHIRYVQCGCGWRSKEFVDPDPSVAEAKARAAWNTRQQAEHNTIAGGRGDRTSLPPDDIVKQLRLGISASGQADNNLMSDAADLIEHLAALATPAPLDDLQRLGQEFDAGVGLREALEQLEKATDDLCATRSQETYLRMVDVDKATDQLDALDAARRRAREVLAALSTSPDTTGDGR